MSDYKLFFIVLLVFLYLIFVFWSKNLENKVNLFFTTIISLCTCIVIVAADFLTLYVVLELQTFCFIILIGSDKISLKKIESALKYFILGGLFSALFVMGLYQYYIETLGTSIFSFNHCISSNRIKLSLNLITMVFLFKLGMVPFYHWLIDVYESVSWFVLALLSSVPKLGYLIIMFQLSFINKNLVITCCMLSIVVGVLGGFNQTKIKRFLAYSSLNHMGLLMVFMVAPLNFGFKVSIIYYVIYVLSFLGFVLSISKFTNLKFYFIELTILKFRDKILSLSIVILFLSLAGLPPLLGFFSKWYAIFVLLWSKQLILGLMVIFFSILAIGYYLRMVKIIYFQAGNEYNDWFNILNKVKKPNLIHLGFISFSIYITVLFILNPDFFLLVAGYFW